MSRSPAPLVVLLVALAVQTAAAEPPDDGATTARPKLDMTPAIACQAVRGYEDYEPLPDATLTKDDKLVVYYRPLGFENIREGRAYRVHLTQDGQIRRRDSKVVLYRKEKLLEYDAKADRPIEGCYIKCIISLKGLAPGDYSLDITLHDEGSKGPPAKQTLKFKVVPVAPVTEEKPGRPE